ncbi:MAG: metal-dependent transcriptional regulator [Candidatus Schekmanbacteria bacterium]|nr:metal-dependent transcriptional regulator [Candidatus Schekmanbacteria bacterium]
MHQDQGYADVWRAFDDNEITHSGAHYLLAIHTLAERGKAPRAVDVSRRLGVSRAAVSSQLKVLKDSGFLDIDGVNRIHLTAMGVDVANRVATKRDVIKVLLSDILGVPEDTAETDACKVEHLLSERSGCALVRLIHFMRSDHIAAVCFRLALKTREEFPCECTVPCDLCKGECFLHDTPGAHN